MRARRVLRDQAGETLVEVMMTVAIVGMAMVAVLGALSASMRLSSTHRTSANTGIALVAAAEAVKTYETGWNPSWTSWFCLFVAWGGYQPAIAELTDLPEGWSPANFAIDAACITVNDAQKARVTITATSPDGSSVESVDVVRRSIS